MTTPQDFRGRATALLGTVISLFSMIGLLAGGWVANLTGVLYGTVISGGLLIITVLIMPFMKGYKELYHLGGKEEENHATMEGIETT